MRICTRAGVAQTPAAHYSILRGVVYANCTNGICIVAGLTVALDRTLVMVDYEDKRKSQCTVPDKILLFHVKIIVLASSVTALGLLKKEDHPIFDPCWLAALESFASTFYPFFIINIFGKHCHACWNFNTDVSVSSGARVCHTFVLAAISFPRHPYI